MNYDNKLNIPGLEIYTPLIIEYIANNYPEYLQANSFVTVNLIRLIDKAGFLVAADFEDEYDDEPSLNASDKDAQGILNILSDEAISQPMSQGTIFKIQEELDTIAGKKLLEFCEFEMGSPQSQCNESSEYSNRGNRRANAGMTEAALEDYNKAILLNPGDFLPVWNRALMFMENDMEGLAFQDALVIYENIMKPENNLQLAFKWINLSTMLMNLNKPFYTISLILKCLKDFNKYQVPYITENNGHSLYIEIKEKCWYNDVDLDSFNKIISTVKELDLKFKEDPKLSPLIKDTKSEIISARVAIGF